MCYAPKGAFLLEKARKAFRMGYCYGVAVLTFAATVAPGIIRADGVSTTPQLVQNVAVTATTTLSMKITAYSSSPDETDSTPFTTANGTEVHDGVVATNALPLGTKITIPKLFGDKVFIVEDRMAERMKNVVDIWMSSKGQAIRFGAHRADIVILKDINKGISER